MKTIRIGKNTNEYIANFPIHTQEKLEEMRATIKKLQKVRFNFQLTNHSH